MNEPIEMTAEQVAQSIQGMSLEQIFADGPRRQFAERVIPKHGTYRLYISRPFGVRKPQGLPWRITITVEMEGQPPQTLNDGTIRVPLDKLGAVIIDATEQMDAHIKANRQTVAKVMRSAMKVVRDEALEVGQ